MRRGSGLFLVLPLCLGGVIARAEAPAPAAFQAAVRDDVDVVLFPAAGRPGPRPSVVAATLVDARPEVVGAVLLNPEAYRQALPALVRTDKVGTRPASATETAAAKAGAGAGRELDHLLAWELEIPLFNLEGRAWLSRGSDWVALELVDGAFAPGRVRFRVAPVAGGRRTLLTCETQVDFRASNFILRRVARHDPWAEAAMSGAVALTLARAVALRAQAPAGHAPDRPRAPMTAPEPSALDGTSLAAAPFAPLRAKGRVALVRRTSGGRLAWSSVGAAVPSGVTDTVARLAAPETWRVFPGWKSLKRVDASFGANTVGGATATTTATRIVVVDNVPFVDLDATWTITRSWPVRARVTDGSTRGGVLAWDAVPAVGDATAALAILSLHPRLDAAGYVERKLIAAEPLLEPALALALAYVWASATAESLGAATR